MATLETLGLAVTPLEEPLSYPGRHAGGSFLLVDDRLITLGEARGQPIVAAGEDAVCAARLAGAGDLDAALSSLHATPLRARAPMVAVGSNAAPAQLRAKLLRWGAPVVVPALQARVAGLGVGHSAHVARAGYVPAAPFADRAARARLLVLWLDEAQRRAVDETEPSYVRQPLPKACTVTLRCGRRLAGTELYRSRHGLLSLDGAAPAPPMPQRALIDLLRRRLDVDERWPSAEAFVRACVGSQSLRAWVTRRLGELGLVAPDRLPGRG
ncbi:MAG: hypothetical protein R6T85_09670 [Egibacteraceae bacterium]